MPAAKTKATPVVVTTEHKGVFFGYLNGDDRSAKTLTITEAQMCVHWSSDVGGVLGLGATGPSKNCRVSPAVPKLTLHGVTAVYDVTEAAVAAWKGRPWA